MNVYRGVGSPLRKDIDHGREEVDVVRRALAVSAAVALALGLAGCTGSEDYSAQTASALQHAVLDLATAAGGNDLPDAQKKLSALESMNDADAKKGEISAARHAAIATSIAAIRADLTQLQDQAEKARLQAQLQQLQQQQQGGKTKGKGDKQGDGGGDGG